MIAVFRLARRRSGGGKRRVRTPGRLRHRAHCGPLHSPNRELSILWIKKKEKKKNCLKVEGERLRWLSGQLSNSKRKRSYYLLSSFIQLLLTSCFVFNFPPSPSPRLYTKNDPECGEKNSWNDKRGEGIHLTEKKSWSTENPDPIHHLFVLFPLSPHLYHIPLPYIFPSIQPLHLCPAFGTHGAL